MTHPAKNPPLAQGPKPSVVALPPAVLSPQLSPLQSGLQLWPHSAATGPLHMLASCFREILPLLTGLAPFL